MDACLELVMRKHGECAEALAEHCYKKNDDEALAMFDEVLEFQFMMLRVLNDAWRERMKEKNEQPQ